MLKSILNSQAALATGGFLLATHYKIVGLTNRDVREPEATFYEPFDRNNAVIVALWHGEHFLVPFLGRRTDRLSPLVTTHRDGEIVARAASYFGLESVRGSGDHGKDFVRKKAVRAFAGMLRKLRDGVSIMMTADVPKVSRVAGAGIATLAKYSQCPIVPVAMTTSRHHRLSNWDRTCINLPFGRMISVRGEEIHVSRDADDAAIEATRQQVEAALNDVTARAYAIASQR
jgi:lysophospholipid acyltransferase (LPLAT)-like uncharacterized protein